MVNFGRLADNSWSFLRSFSPFSYRDMSNKKLKHSIGYLIFLGLLSLIALLALYAPLLFSMQSTLGQGLASFTTLNVSFNFVTKGPVAIRQLGLLADSKLNSTAGLGANLVFAKDWIAAKPLYCQVSWLWCRLEGNKPEYTVYSDMSDISKNQDKYSSMATAILLLILPSVIILLGIAEAVKLTALILVFFLLGFLLTRLFLIRLKAVQILNIAVYATTPLFILEIVRLRFSPWILSSPILPIVLYTLLYGSALYLLKDRLDEEVPQSLSQRQRKGKEKTEV